MKSSAWRVAEPADYDDYAPAGNDSLGELLPEDRIGDPRSRSGGKTVLATSVLIVASLGASWLLFGDQMTWSNLPLKAALAPSLDKTTPGARDTATAALPARATPTPAPATLEPPALTPAAATTGPAETPAVKTAALPPAATSYDDAAAAPLRPAIADPSDPIQMRASAAGLHPELSRALLSRLSSADYRNAGIAIKTALAQTADDAVVSWPREPKPSEALFEVHFVPGAAPGCRRYVVTVAKDGWLTTALPIEKCTAQNKQVKRG